MDEVARLIAKDRADLFNEAARRKQPLRPEIIEKDFWVCWILREIFALQDLPGVIFKGGTSLSKVWNVIERFSEDVDLSFDRAALGFAGDLDPAKAGSANQRERRLKELSAACREMIAERFAPPLIQRVGERLGSAPGPNSWDITEDGSDPSGQSLLFTYPLGLARGSDPLPYLRPHVRLEMGARSDHWPAEHREITPYAAEVLPSPLWKSPKTRVRVLDARRTFWDKAAILHKLHHWPAEKPFPERQSRHYYDLAKLFQTAIGREAVADWSLLDAVREHQLVFFSSSKAKFEEMVPQTLRLVPTEQVAKLVARDYEVMRSEMIFGEALEFEMILATLAEIERQVNSA